MFAWPIAVRRRNEPVNLPFWKSHALRDILDGLHPVESRAFESRNLGERIFNLIFFFGLGNQERDFAFYRFSF
jgi:hypothetical protein